MDGTTEKIALYILFALAVIILLIREVASYRLAASHPLNRLLNPPHDRGNRGADDAGVFIETGCDGGD